MIGLEKVLSGYFQYERDINKTYQIGLANFYANSDSVVRFESERFQLSGAISHIERNKKYTEAEQKALAEKAKKEEEEEEEEARIKKLTESVIVSCFEKSFAEYDYQEYITYKFVIQNKSEKEIRAVKGSISFTNLFDDEIKSLSFLYDQPIGSEKEVNWNAQTDYNQFMDDDVSLKNKDLKDIKVVWKPEKIIFADGTILE